MTELVRSDATAFEPERVFETGWGCVDIREQAQLRVEAALRALGASVDTLDLGDWETAFRAWLHLKEYEGEYRNYAGVLEHCLLEKALEHFLSIALIRPRSGATGVDVGSCTSVLPSLVRRIYGVRYFEQDLQYPAGVHGDRIGSGADRIPLEGGRVDFLTLHCAFEHFEGNADTGLIRECSRLLRQGGTAVILPLYLNEAHCNVTGESDATARRAIAWDTDATHYSYISDWNNRFGRHYSPDAFMRRVYAPATASGLTPRLYKVVRWDRIHPALWLRWILTLQK